MKLVVDLQSISRDHIPFNTAFLKLLRQAARNEPIAMLCRQDHADAIAPYVADDDIRFLALPSHLHEPPRGRFVRFDEREQHAFVETIWRQTSADHLILLGCRADMLERLRRRPPPVAMDVVLHATLAEGIKWRSRNPLRRRRDMFATLRRRFPSTVRLIFLEQGIADRARPLIGRDAQYAILPHPIVGSPMETAPGPDRHMIKVGFLGEDAMGKGFAHFMELARHAPPHLQLNCIGRRGPSYDPSSQPAFHRPPSDAKLTQEEYRDLARENDLIFLPFDPDWYSLTASGTLLDCVRFGIPPLAVRNSVIDDLERRYGRFGFLVSSPSEGIDLLCRTDPATLFEEMEQFRGPLRAIAHDRTIEALSPGFRRIFSSPFQRG